VLDPSRRLLIVSCDGEERLLLLGEGQVLNAPAPAPVPAQSPAVPLRKTPTRKARKPKADA